jgi:hypothetical protein
MKPTVGYRCLLVAVGLALGSGCGLSEYQSKYQKQQGRINYLDDENRYLGRPVELVAKKDSTGPIIRLRLPRGVSTNHDEEPLGVLYRYPKISSKIPLGDDAKISDLDSAYIAFETAKDWSQFKKRVLEPFKAADPQTTRPINLEIPGRPARTFETTSFTDGSDPTWAFRFYFFRDEVYRVAIGFRASEAALASETSRQAMEFSVKSLAVGKATEKKNRATDSH